jgi:hypothetical protein
MRITAALLTAIAILGGGGCAPMPRGMAQLPVPVLFHPADTGALPRHFAAALTGGGGPVSWVVRSDPTSPAGPVLVQQSTDDTSYRFPLCIYDGVIATNVLAEVMFKPISGTVDQAGGIVLRYTPENYYVARANALEDNVSLFKTVNGNRTKIAEVPARVAPGQWHRLRFFARGTHLRVWFDEKRLIDADDATITRPGKVGLWTKADSVSAFADLKIGTRW